MTRELEARNNSVLAYIDLFILINGKKISWQHLVTLYHTHRGNGEVPDSGMSILYKLRREHVQLTSYSKMRVDLAAQVINLHA